MVKRIDQYRYDKLRQSRPNKWNNTDYDQTIDITSLICYLKYRCNESYESKYCNYNICNTYSQIFRIVRRDTRKIKDKRRETKTDRITQSVAESS